MAMARAGESRFPMVECRLDDVVGPRGWEGETGGADAVEESSPGSGPALRLVGPPTGRAREWAREAVGSDLALQTTARVATRLGIVLHVRQMFRGHPIVGSELTVVRMPGRTVLVGAPIRSVVGPAEGGPRDQPRRVVASRAVGLMGGREEEVERGTVDRVLFPQPDGDEWAYRVGIQTGDADLRCFLRDDEELSLLYADDLSLGAARAQVHTANPLRTPAPVDVELTGVVHPPGWLRRAWLDVRPATGAPMEQADGDFRPRTPAGEASAYHHLSRGVARLRAVVGDDIVGGKPFRPLEVLVDHRGSRAQVGLFFPGSGQIRFGDRPSAALSADVCLHELTHAAVNRLGHLDDDINDPVAAGLNEGFADYMQASILDDPRFGDHVSGEPGGARTCAAVAPFPPAPTAAGRYDLGTAWASLLWALRSAVGRDAADALALHSVVLLTAHPTYVDAQRALLDAEAAIFGHGAAGPHHGDILAVCAAHGFP